ncbi:MAG: UTP--glucose-1-phosphate uridylyltransferase GalU [Gammaproteobacteria bacterium]|nr:UTP--glucose-1-phosphate uridylyltransferase GalU [Gammaproteobacteria bacterium]
MANVLKKAIFPVAGLGTRFLPATKATPKEMLPIVDKPLIQFAVEEAVAAGIKELIFVTSYSKRAIEDHFDCNHELEAKLEQRGQLELLKIVHNILPPGVTCTYIRQAKALGLGHAVLCAKNQVNNEPFAVVLADDLIEEGSQGCLHEMVDVFTKTQSSIIALEEILPCNTDKYGIVELYREAEKYDRISHIVEKPSPEKAPSNLAVVGRYILQPSIFKALEETSPDAKGEIQLTDAISRLLEEEAIYGYHLTGKRYDCGSKLGYLQATVNYALKHPEVADPFKAYLKDELSHLYF